MNWTITIGGTIVQSDIAHSGSYAALFQTNLAETIVPEINAGYGTEGIPISENYSSLKFHYQYIEDGSDKVVVAITIADEDYITLGQGGLEIEDPMEDYALAFVPIEYTGTGTAAHAFIQIFLADGTGFDPPSNETYFIIDDVEFSGSVGIDEANTDISSISIFPQPASDKVHVTITTEKMINSLQISLFDLSGRIMNAYQFDGTKSGKNEVSIDVSNLIPGLYFARIDADGRISTKKIVVE